MTFVKEIPGAPQDIAEGIGLSSFTVRGVQIWDSEKMDNSLEGNLYRTNQAIGAGVKDFGEDVKNDPK